MNMRVMPVAAMLAALLCCSAPAQRLLSPATRIDPDVVKLRQKIDRGVKGKVFATCDDEFVFYLNDKKVLDGELSKVPDGKSVTLKPGDVITVRATNLEGERGFAMIFTSENGRVVISSNSGDWHAYKPASEIRWWEIKNADAMQKTKAVRADNQSHKGDIEGPAAQGCDEAIWGDMAADTVYLLRVIGYEDLME